MSDEEYMKVVYGIENYQGRKRRGAGIVIPMPEPEDKYLGLPIEDLELGVRAMNCLHRAGIDTIGDLVKLSEQEVSRIRNAGIRTVREIKDRLGNLGLSLRSVDESDY